MLKWFAVIVTEVAKLIYKTKEMKRDLNLEYFKIDIKESKVWS